MRHNVFVFLKKACVFVAAGYYFTGDGAYRSKEGYYQITGRLDDVINVSGHRIGTAEIEDVLVKSISDWIVVVFRYCLLLKSFKGPILYPVCLSFIMDSNGAASISVDLQKNQHI